MVKLQRDNFRTALRRLPLEGPAAVSKTECNREVAMQTAVLQQHQHDPFGCGDDFTCKSDLPRELVEETSFLPGTLMVRIKRTGRYFSPFIYSLMLSSPFNMASYVMCDASRFERRMEQWRILNEAGATRVSSDLLLVFNI
jgi:hypothetical protein